jgi:hypothetical protein
MRTSEIAGMFGGRRSGEGWIARCPAHPDRHPSLSIRKGNGDKTILHCFGGCTTPKVLAASGLRMRDLFVGRPPSPLERRKALALQEAQQRRAKMLSRAEGEAADEVRWSHLTATWLGAMLANSSDNDPSGDALCELFHITLDHLRAMEAGIR